MAKIDKIKLFKALTWDNVDLWVGQAISNRGKNYQRYGNVQELAYAPDGSLIAQVEGNEIYITSVDIIPGPHLRSVCTCPYQEQCKHAVAVVLGGEDAATRAAKLRLKR